ncbi:hypothetical protein BD310DRAFT_729447 [Dichomitus squalens]|uniref:Uncharacterized protein n=1 Tax=Dichomitus squalens TaxID=114155 RepID=A0A4Q9PKP4_9APHY|nr:hypothetical protein BD310DRAFT_729447 [Dichomitus squalens]
MKFWLTCAIVEMASKPATPHFAGAHTSTASNPKPLQQAHREAPDIRDCVCTGSETRKPLCGAVGCPQSSVRKRANRVNGRIPRQQQLQRR